MHDLEGLFCKTVLHWIIGQNRSQGKNTMGRIKLGQQEEKQRRGAGVWPHPVGLGPVGAERLEEAGWGGRTRASWSLRGWAWCDLALAPGEQGRSQRRCGPRSGTGVRLRQGRPPPARCRSRGGSKRGAREQGARSSGAKSMVAGASCAP